MELVHSRFLPRAEASLDCEVIDEQPSLGVRLVKADSWVLATATEMEAFYICAPRTTLDGHIFRPERPHAPPISRSGKGGAKTLEASFGTPALGKNYPMVDIFKKDGYVRPRKSLGGYLGSGRVMLGPVSS